MLSKSSSLKRDSIKPFGSLFGGIELGGTKTICGIGAQEGEILAEKRTARTSVREILDSSVDFLKKQGAIFGEISAIDVASFGLLDLRLASV